MTILDDRVKKELSKLPHDVFAHFLHVAELLEEFGPDAVSMPHVRPLSGGIWEMRMKGKDGIGRAIYIKAQDSKLVVVHAFTKKTQKTPNRALNIARTRAKGIT